MGDARVRVKEKLESRAALRASRARPIRTGCAAGPRSGLPKKNV